MRLREHEALIALGYYDADENIPRAAPDVFAKTGTISIIVNDMREPQGRIYFGGFLISAILFLISQSPFWLYRPWDEGELNKDEMGAIGKWILARERALRTVGYVAPPCLLALCAIVVTPQDPQPKSRSHPVLGGRKDRKDKQDARFES